MLFELVLPVLSAAIALVKVVLDSYRTRQKEQRTEEKVKEIEQKAEKEPEKIRFAWDLARTKLEAYFDRNLNQVKSIFWVSIFVMIVGFGFVAYGIIRSINDPERITATYIASISGIITEFIGVTLMLIYRSTLQQAGAFMTVLEKINSVGMAVQILDSISDGHDTLKNETRAEIVKMLLTRETMVFAPPTHSITTRKRKVRRDSATAEPPVGGTRPPSAVVD
jgi:hypothetical protein